MEKIIWYSPDLKKPIDGQKIAFKPIGQGDEQEITYEGLYIEKEDMFYVGYDDCSEWFFFSWDIAFWKKLN